jgi:hypothetical protein
MYFVLYRSCCWPVVYKYSNRSCCMQYIFCTRELLQSQTVSRAAVGLQFISIQTLPFWAQISLVCDTQINRKPFDWFMIICASFLSVYSLTYRWLLLNWSWFFIVSNFYCLLQAAHLEKYEDPSVLFISKFSPKEEHELPVFILCACFVACFSLFVLNFFFQAIPHQDRIFIIAR